MRPWRSVAFVMATACVLPLRAQSPQVAAIVDKAADYVAGYTRDFVGVVAEETYRQDVQGARGTDPRGFPIEGSRQKRELKSDVLLVRAPAGDQWMQFRDVFEVDGKPVRDRAERLARLFLDRSATAQEQVQAITAESARYNIGSVSRTINLPVLALAVLEPGNRPWSAFNGRQKKDGPDSIWELDFHEERGNTLIRTSRGQPMPARGKLIVEGASGRIVSTELAADDEAVRAQIEVSYAAQPVVGLWMPREMREKYVTKGGMTIEGRAAYSKFRRYQVTVDQTIKK